MKLTDFMTGWFITLFLDELKKEKLSILNIGAMLVVVPVYYIIFKVLINEHANMVISRCKAMTGQIIRGLFFRKLKTANLAFLDQLPSSIIPKILFYEIEIVSEFIGILPIFIAAPFGFIGSFGFIIWKIGLAGVASLGFFIVILIILLGLSYKKMKARKVFIRRASMRSILFIEIIGNIKIVKINSLEKSFQGKLFYLRKLEMNA